jgi:hypothetical protein
MDGISIEEACRIRLTYGPECEKYLSGGKLAGKLFEIITSQQAILIILIISVVLVGVGLFKLRR